jgi:hypothetical protein
MSRSLREVIHGVISSRCLDLDCGADGRTRGRTLALTVGIAAATLGFSPRSSACDFNLSEGVWS